MSTIPAPDGANEALLLTGEGVQRLDETRLANLTEFLSDLEITVTPIAQLGPTGPQEDTVSREDFREHWGKGYGSTYSYLLRLAHNNDDIPLRAAEDLDTLVGNLDAAIDWMKEHKPGISSTKILGLIRETRAEQVAATARLAAHQWYY